ncbi:hypothetical protein CF641_33575 [Burkholderia pseudomallei]|nr:hypothetical protein CF641_33575 [Burkholderia pseudomallei]PNX30142.1 hypothetical protein CF642_33870 [Burkholderia pseudomallei]
MKAAKRSSVAARSRVAGGGAPPAPHARTGSKRRAAAARRGTRMARQGGCPYVFRQALSAALGW